MNTETNFLDVNPGIIEKNLKFVKNDVEEELEQIFGGSESSLVDSKIIKPKPGMCIKCYKVNTVEKFFINLCHTDSILPPENITENELQEILQSHTPSSYRIPISITDPRLTKDKSGKDVYVCDVAINQDFYKKCEKILLFRDFLIAIILEAINNKYNIELSPDNWIILKNRKLMGTLISHRIRNCDMKRVYDSYKNPTENDKKLMNEIIGKKLIQEITIKESEKLKKKNDMILSKNPEYRLYGKIKYSKVNEIIGEFYLPECISENDLTLDIGEDRIVLESLKYGYAFDKFVNFSIDRDKITATFDQARKVLQVQMPLV